MCVTTTSCSCLELRDRRCLRTKSLPPRTQIDGLREALRRAKAFRFADAEGLPLVSVLKFWETDSVEDLLSAKGGRRHHSEPSSRQPSFLSDRDEYLSSLRLPDFGDLRHSTTRDAFQVPRTPRKELIWEEADLLCCADTSQALKQRHLCLETVAVHGLTVFGTVRVRNLAFDKAVVVRYSSDGWKTHSDLQACYVAGSSDGRTDRFSFTLVVPESTPPGSKLQFAINFRCDGGDYWDNNDGRNFSVFCRQIAEKPRLVQRRQSESAFDQLTSPRSRPR